MSSLSIRVNNLSKRYRIGSSEAAPDTLAGTLGKWLSGPLRNYRRLRSLTRFAEGDRRSGDVIWALDDVSFELKNGEVLGIIGRNGAGKTTLLKILSRITYPTSGRVELHGRVASLLEVGTGFHPELTGRENIYLNGTILGMRKYEIDQNLDAIVAFSGVESFLDTPVKRYSSGMRVRLAFSVAAHLEAEILLVDEVLAVGDTEFREKCMGKMEEVADGGRTVLFVSHNLQSVSTLTKRALLLERGKLAFLGETSETLRRYRMLWDRPGEQDVFCHPEKNEGVVRAAVITSEPNKYHRYGHPLCFEFTIAFRERPKSAAFSFQIMDESMRAITHLWIYDSEHKWSKKGTVRLRCFLQQPSLYMGRYTLTTHLAERAGNQKLEKLDLLCPFTVVMDGVPNEYPWAPGACTYLEAARWSVAAA